MTAPATTKRVDELRLLEAEAVHIIREVVAELERPTLRAAGRRSLVLDTADANTEDLAAQVIALLDERGPRPQSSAIERSG